MRTIYSIAFLLITSLAVQADPNINDGDYRLITEFESSASDHHEIHTEIVHISHKDSSLSITTSDGVKGNIITDASGDIIMTLPARDKEGAHVQVYCVKSLASQSPSQLEGRALYITATGERKGSFALEQMGRN